MNEIVTLEKLYSSLQNEMISKANFSVDLVHPVDKGNNAEQNWLDWFNNYFPKRYKAAKATIIDSKGNSSDQIDVVLYDNQYSYLAFNQNGILYIPAESVYAVFEVKQVINKNNMEYAGKKAESVRLLHRTSAPIKYAQGVYPAKELHHIIAGILATSSDWNEPFGKPFKKTFIRYNDLQKIDCGCVLNTGAFFYNYNDNKLSTSVAGESLVYFFLQLLISLQEIGTVPAIDLKEYMRKLTISEEKT